MSIGGDGCERKEGVSTGGDGCERKGCSLQASECMKRGRKWVPGR